MSLPAPLLVAEGGGPSVAVLVLRGHGHVVVRRGRAGVGHGLGQAGQGPGRAGSAQV